MEDNRRHESEREYPPQFIKTREMSAAAKMHYDADIQTEIKINITDFSLYENPTELPFSFVKDINHL